MDSYISAAGSISQLYHSAKTGGAAEGIEKISANSYFLENGDILVLPGDEGDCRYLYGRDGFNFWAYSSGYMSCNDGLFSIFNRVSEGQEPRIGFFAGFPDEGGLYEAIPLLPVPVSCFESFLQAERYVVFSGSAAYYYTEAGGIRFCVRAFPDDEKNLHFTINIENQTENTREIFISSYLNPFLRHDLFENPENRWFREVRYLPPKAGSNELGPFLLKVNEDLDRVTSISNYAIAGRKLILAGGSKLKGHEETASRYEYVGGSRSSLHTPASLRAGRFLEGKHVCAFTEVAAAGDLIHLSLEVKSTIRYDISISFLDSCRNEGELEEKLKRLPERVTPDSKLEAMHRAEACGLKPEFRGSETEIVKAGALNSFFTHLMRQVEFCSLLKGYVQPSPLSLIGIRDVFQALEGFAAWEPAAARKKILEALGFVLTDGRCPRQYALPLRDGRLPPMDLRPFIDQGSWVVSAVAAYLKYTGDMGFLEEMCGYCEIADESKGLVQRTSQKDSVMEHLLRITDYLLDKRDFGMTGCIRALYGDWNDALDGLGVSRKPDVRYGSGVSVMASLHVYQNLREMAEILEEADRDKYASRIGDLTIARKELAENIKKYAVVSEGGERRILHGWGDDRSYLVGSFGDPDGESRRSLTSNAFWVLSGMNDADSMEEDILKAYDKLDTKYGFKTFEPYFAPGTPGVGRIHKLPRGTAENGAVYVHASAFAAMSLFRLGHPQKGWEQLCKLLPITHEKLSCSPYVMPNSYGYNEELGIDGESMQDWQTGSSNVVFKTYVRYVFGIEPGFDGLWLQPAGWSPFRGFSLQITIRGCRVALVCENTGRGSREYYLDNVKQDGVYSKATRIERLFIPWQRLDKPEAHIRVVG